MGLVGADGQGAINSLQYYFRESVCVTAIAEPLVSFDRERPSVEVRDYLLARNFDVVGVRVGGMVVGWSAREDLSTGICAEHTRLFERPDIVQSTDHLADLIHRLSEREQLFVSSLGAVAAIVTRADLQKPPVRMWLFGLVTVLEDSFLKLLKQRYPNQGWRSIITKNRLKHAERLQYERARRNQSLDLESCLHFSDKADILLRDSSVREHLGFTSRRQARESLWEAEHLRNQLAHSHDIVTSSLPAIVNLASRVDRILDLTDA